MEKENILTREEYNKKIKRCERFGAKKFKKVVDYIETKKFKLLKKIYPNYINKINSLYDRKEKKLLKKCKTEEEKQLIKIKFNYLKMLNKREDTYEMNRNYHLFGNRFSELLTYLKYNKSVHVKGMIMDTALIPVLVAGSFINPVFIPMVALDIASLFINFQCVNLQNYNIYKIEKNKDKLLGREQRTVRKTQENYSDGVRTINKIMESPELSMEDKLKSIQTQKESLIQMRELILEENKRRNATSKAKAETKVKKLGGI